MDPRAKWEKRAASAEVSEAIDVLGVLAVA